MPKKKRRTKHDIYRRLNDDFNRCLGVAFQSAFGLKLDTQWDLVGMRHISYRADEKMFSKEQAAFLSAFESGYFTAASEATR